MIEFKMDRYGLNNNFTYITYISNDCTIKNGVINKKKKNKYKAKIIKKDDNSIEANNRIIEMNMNARNYRSIIDYNPSSILSDITSIILTNKKGKSNNKRK